MLLRGAKVSSWGFEAEFGCCWEDPALGFLRLVRVGYLPKVGGLPKEPLSEGDPSPSAEAPLTAGPSTLFLVIWSQSRDVQPSLGCWALQRTEGRREGCSFLPSASPPRALRFLGDLGSVPSPPCFGLPICTQQPRARCKVSLAPRVSGRMGSYEAMPRSPSPNLRVARPPPGIPPCLWPFCSSLPSLLCDLDGMSRTFLGSVSWRLRLEHLFL